LEVYHYLLSMVKSCRWLEYGEKTTFSSSFFCVCVKIKEYTFFT